MRAKTHARQRNVGTLLPAALLTAVLAAATLLAPGTVVGQEGLALGDRPDTPVLAGINGDSLDFATVVGKKPVLVEFWATWCTICRALEPRMQAAHEAYGDRVEFLTVAIGVAQTEAQVRQHLARHPAPGRVLWDGRGAAVRAFEAPGTGYIVILDADGTVAYTGTGTDQDLVGALRDMVGN